MAVDKVVIEIVGDTKDIDSTIKKLEKVGKVDRKNAKSFKKSSKEFQKEQQKNVQSVDKLSNQVSSFGRILLGAFTVTALFSFGKQLFKTAVQMEAFEKRAKTVFGSSIGIIERFAKENARNLGLTETAFKGAAAAIGDILVPLGLSRKRAAEMSTEAVKLGAALKEFSGDQRTAAEISQVVAKSFTGELEGLKGLGVVVNQNDKDFKALVKTKIVNLGLTEQQAKAETIFETVIAKSTDALAQFENNTDSLARQQAILNAESEQLTETLAELLTPALLSSVTALNELTSGFNVVAKADVSFLTKIFALSGNLGSLVEIALAAAKADLELAKAAEAAAEATEEINEQEIERIRNVFFLKNEIDALRKEQAAQGTELIRVAEINKELIPLQKELNKLMGKESKDAIKDGNEALQRRIDLLSLFQDEVKETISQIDAQIAQQQALSEVTEEEEDAIRTGTEFRVAEFQKSLDGRRQALEIELANEEIDQELFNIKIAQLDEEAADNKIKEAQRAADAVGAIANASFNLLIGLQDRKLQLLENETTLEIRELQERRDQNLITEEEFEEKKRAILKETDDKRRELLTKRAKLQKTAAIIEATINTAVAVTEVIAQPILAALIAVLGAAEIATIAAQPIPEFHTGKKSELKEGELYAKILKSESVIPPEQSKKYKGAIDSMIDKKFENYIFHEYMLPMIKGMGKKEISEPYNDIMLWNNQKRQILLTRETNKLLRGLQPNGNPWRSWR